MQMVAGAKLRRTQEQLFQARPYVDRLEAITRRFVMSAPGLAHPLLEHPAIEEIGATAPIALVLVTSDTGLCGAYNERLLAKAAVFLAETRAVVVPIGRKGLWAARRHGWPILTHRTELGGKVTETLVQSLAQELVAAYQGGAVSAVRIVYTAFRSALSWHPTMEKWLPLPHPETTGPGSADLNLRYLYEPTPVEIAERLFPAHLTAKLRQLLLEAVTSEHSARMVAMKAATDNAEEMIEHLTLVRNKVRQATITKEISEIAAGAEALKG